MEEDPDLTGCHILLVEDEHMVAKSLARLLDLWGAKIVGPAPTVETAFALLRSTEKIDYALLDVTLREGTVFQLADALMAAACHSHSPRAPARRSFRWAIVTPPCSRTLRSGRNREGAAADSWCALRLERVRSVGPPLPPSPNFARMGDEVVGFARRFFRALTTGQG